MYDELVKDLRHCVYGDCCDCNYYDNLNCVDLAIKAADAIEELMRQCEQLPSADAVPVVMCKDCKWWIPHGKGTPASIPAIGECGYKKFSGCSTMLCEFCFWGERKDDE